VYIKIDMSVYQGRYECISR